MRFSPVRPMQDGELRLAIKVKEVVVRALLAQMMARFLSQTPMMPSHEALLTPSPSPPPAFVSLKMTSTPPCVKALVWL